MASGPSSVSSLESDSTSDLLEDDALAKHLEQIIFDVHDALNRRMLDMNAYPWTVFKADFKCEAAYTLKYTTSLESYLQDVGGLFVRNPELLYRVEDISSHISRNALRADLFMNHLTMGWPLGLIRRSVGIASFRLVDEEWRIVSFKQAPGYGSFTGL